MHVVPRLVARPRRSRLAPEDIRLEAKTNRLSRTFADRLSDRLISSRYGRGNLHAYDSLFSLGLFTSRAQCISRDISCQAENRGGQKKSFTLESSALTGV